MVTPIDAGCSPTPTRPTAESPRRRQSRRGQPRVQQPGADAKVDRRNSLWRPPSPLCLQEAPCDTGARPGGAGVTLQDPQVPARGRDAFSRTERHITRLKGRNLVRCEAVTIKGAVADADVRYVIA